MLPSVGRTMKRPPQPVFISGHPRSGTNLMCRCLDGHPEVFAAPGWGKLQVLRRLMFVDWEDLSVAEAASRIIHDLELGKPPEYMEKLRRMLAEQPEPMGSLQDVATLLIACLQRLENQEGAARYWVEKNHNLEFYFERGKRALAGSKLIFMLRDPVSTYASWKKMVASDELDMSPAQHRLNLQKHLVEDIDEAMVAGATRPDAMAAVSARHGVSGAELQALFEAYHASGCDDTVLRKPLVKWRRLEATEPYAVRFAWNLRYMRETAHRLQQRYPDEVLLVGYESLVRDPRGQMEACAEFLGVPYDPVLERPSESGQPWQGNTSYRSGTVGIYQDSLARRGDVEAEEIAGIRAVLDPE